MVGSRSHYDVLGIDRDADDAAVRRAWKVLVQVWHPDRFSGDMREEAERTAARINESYHVLRDAARRAAYDRRLDAELAVAAAERAPRRPPSASAPPRGPFASSSPFAMREAAARSHDPHGGSGAGSTRAQAAIAQAQRPLGEVTDEFARELWQTVRRKPRLSAVTATVITLFFAWAVITTVFLGPSLPAMPSANAAGSVDARQPVIVEQSNDSARDLAADSAADTQAALTAGAGDLPSDAELGLAPGIDAPQGPLTEEQGVGSIDGPGGYVQPPPVGDASRAAGAAGSGPGGRIVRIMPRQQRAR